MVSVPGFTGLSGFPGVVDAESQNFTDERNKCCRDTATVADATATVAAAGPGAACHDSDDSG